MDPWLVVGGAAGGLAFGLLLWRLARESPGRPRAARPRGPVGVPERLSGVHTAVCRDGATMVVYGTDEHGRERAVELTSALPAAGAGRLPGRLYLDDRPVPVRGEAEAAILRLLGAAADDVGRLAAGEVHPRAAEGYATDIRRVIAAVRLPHYGRPG